MSLLAQRVRSTSRLTSAERRYGSGVNNADMGSRTGEEGIRTATSPEATATTWLLCTKESGRSAMFWLFPDSFASINLGVGVRVVYS